jgi:hypothetical protein
MCELAANPAVTNPDSPDPVLTFRWLNLLNEAMLSMGLQLRVAPTLKDLLRDAGFVDIVETKFEVPWGAWPEDRRQKAIGFWHMGMCIINHGFKSSYLLILSRTTTTRPSGDYNEALLESFWLDGFRNRDFYDLPSERAE